MKTIIIYSGSKELLRAAIASDRDEVVNGTISFGFSDAADEEPTSFDSGEWALPTLPTIEEIDGKYLRAYIAQILVGGLGSGADVELPEGDNYAWTQLNMGDGQVIVKPAGKVTVL